MQRNILSVFLASPGDLQEERNVARTSVDRVNKILARRVGWQIELLGWEDTLPSYSRPQSLINKDVDSSDLFLGILWRRWGQDTGKFSSGFEEEFIRAIDRRRKTGKPEIWLFFKEIEEESKKDPGDQLKRVLKFKEEQIELKELMFKEFSDIEKWGQIIHDGLIAHVLDLVKFEPETVTQEQSVALEFAIGERVTKEDQAEDIKVDYPVELVSLFDKIIDKLKKGSAVAFDTSEGTRFFLQSSAWFSETHLGEVFGNHEINLAYTKRSEWEISESERWFLLRSFLSDTHNNRPGWFWLKGKNETEIDNFLQWLLKNDTNVSVRRGAINLLADTFYRANRDIIESGLADNDDNVIIDSIRLIRNAEKEEYLELLEPFINNENSLIRETAIEVQIELLYLKDPNQSFSFLIQSGTKIPPLIDSKFNALDLQVKPDLLLKGLKGSETPIRRFCAKYLRKSKLISKDDCNELLKDPDSLVRKEGLLELIELEEEIDMDFIKKLFPEPKQSGRGLLGYGLSLPEVRADDFIPMLFKKRSPEKLLSQLNFFNVNSEEAYRVLAIDYFQELKGRIRTDLDSEFETLRSNSEQKLKEQYGDVSESISKSFKPEVLDFIKGNYISAALDGLALHGEKGDVKYARKYLGNTRHNVADYAALKLLSRFGESSDVNKLLDIASKSYGETKKMALEVALNLSENKNELLNNLMDHEDKVISNFSIIKLSIYDTQNKAELAKKLLNYKDDDRRIQGLSILLMNLSETELEGLLNEYLKQNTYYYNVVTWLDRCLYSTGRYKKHFHSKLANKMNRE